MADGGDGPARPTADLPPLDVLVVGSGVAGLSAAVRLAELAGLRVGVLTKAELVQSTTRWAQGGVAAVLGGDEDSVDLHHADTLAAGAGLCDPEAVRILVSEGPDRVHELIAAGAVFDREHGGALALAREGGHSTARVVHAGGAATGAEVERALVAALRRGAAAILEGWFAVDLLVDGGRCAGVLAVDPGGHWRDVPARNVLLASGGAGQLYAVTTNPAEATGDGMAMALRAGVAVADVEFVQFHPTALHHPAMPRPLLSEALRGHGARLRDAAGDQFVDELASRDVVSRAMAERMAAQKVEHLWLDATGLAAFDTRFPTLAASLHAVGLDPAVDWLPIAPAAHHIAGGVLTDLDGATALPGLWAVGEVACSGVHGANRLASNSLLEGMVFGARAAEALASGKDGPEPTGALGPLWAGGSPGAVQHGTAASEDGSLAVRAIDSVEPPPWADELDRAVEDALEGAERAMATPSGAAGGVTTGAAAWRQWLQRAMTEGAGVVRDASSLAAAASTVAAAAAAAASPGWDASRGRGASRGRDARIAGMPGWAPPAADPTAPRVPGVPGDMTDLVATAELANLATVGWALLRAASARTETRGAHTRRDFPNRDDTWRLRLVHLAAGPTVTARAMVTARSGSGPGPRQPDPAAGDPR